MSDDLVSLCVVWAAVTFWWSLARFGFYSDRPDLHGFAAWASFPAAVLATAIVVLAP